jgi:hypothetical protein
VFDRAKKMLAKGSEDVINKMLEKGYEDVRKGGNVQDSHENKLSYEATLFEESDPSKAPTTPDSSISMDPRSDMSDER